MWRDYNRALTAMAPKAAQKRTGKVGREKVQPSLTVTRLRAVGQREAKGHTGPLADAALDLDAAIVGLGYGLGDG